MRRRAREVAQFGQEAEAAAHAAYGKAIRAGQDLKLRSPAEVLRHGGKLLQEKADRAGAAVENVARQTKSVADDALRRAGQNPIVRFAAVQTATGVGNVAGVVRGGVHAVEGLANGAVFAGRLLNPFDRLMSSQGESAAEQLERATSKAAQTTVNYVKKGVADPRSVVEDVRDVGHQWNRDLNPAATPVAPTLKEELRRNFDIGQNQGELLFDAGSVVVGGPAAKAIKGLSRAANVGNEAKYLAQGFSPRAAAHLAEPYPTSNMGHHFISRDTKLSGGGSVPRSYSDGPFNKLAPPGISRGDFYELHYQVDPRFHGTGVKGESWSGRNLGLAKHGPIGRLWHGSPAPLKARVGGLGATAGNGFYNSEDGGAW